MEQSIVYFPLAPNADKALSVLLDALTDTLDHPEATLTAGAVVPLLTVIIELSGKLEETMLMLSQRLASCEAALSSSKDLSHPKPQRPERLSR